MRGNNAWCWVLLLLGGLACGAAWGDIRTTPHSLVRKSVKADGSDVCVFCHTPNQSGTPPENPPLWQHSIGTDLIFTIYDDIGRMGLGKQSVGSQSIACLSCHDANQAWLVSNSNLSSDHPFGVPYRGAIKRRLQPSNGQGSTQAQTDEAAPAIIAKKLVANEDFRDVSQGVVEDRTAWWVSASGTTSKRARSDLPLYPRQDDASGEELPFIECSSCHDPHSSNMTFLRIPNDGSRLCLTCHMK